MSLFASVSTMEVEAASDKEVKHFSDFTVSFLTEKKVDTPLLKRKASFESGGEGAVVNLDNDSGDAWIDAVVYANGTSIRYAGGSVQRGKRGVFIYGKLASADAKYQLGLKKTYNTGDQGSSNNRKVTIKGRWSPDAY